MKVYICDTEELLDSGLFKRCYREVSSHRREKIDKYKNEASKRQSLAAGILLEKAFCEWRLSAPSMKTEEKPAICVQKNGKPYLRDYPGFYFNLSHTNGRAMCVASDSPVGCDVEGVEKDSMKVAERFYSKAEYELLLGTADEHKRTEMFFVLWTLKESFVKLTGEGIYRPFDSFGFDISEEGKILLSQNKDFSRGDFNDDYLFYSFGEQAFRYSIAIKKNRSAEETVNEAVNTDCVLQKGAFSDSRDGSMEVFPDNCYFYSIGKDELTLMRG